MELEPFVFRRDGVLVGLRGEDGGADGLADEVNRFTLWPLGRDAFVAFTLDLCHNQVDRHFSRFPEEELATINRLVPGRPLMERHDLRGSLPRGTFFRSELHRDGERVSVRPDVYVLKTAENDHFIRNIEGGVYRETSIGFSFQLPEASICGRDLRRCDHVPGPWLLFRNVLEAVGVTHRFPCGRGHLTHIAAKQTLLFYLQLSALTVAEVIPVPSPFAKPRRCGIEIVESASRSRAFSIHT